MLTKAMLIGKITLLKARLHYKGMYSLGYIIFPSRNSALTQHQTRDLIHLLSSLLQLYNQNLK